MTATRIRLAFIYSLLFSLSCTADENTGPIQGADQDFHPPPAYAIGGSVVADHDTYVASADNTSRGARDSMVVDGVGSNRVLVRVNQSAITGLIGSGTLTSARLELTIKSTNTGWPASGGTIDLFRVLKNWTEAGATWNCAIDSNTGNTKKDCSGTTAWTMSSGSGVVWATARTAQFNVTNGKAGVVSLDVTADVLAFLGGSNTNYGWILKRTSEGVAGRISFRSSEHISAPRLVLTVAAANPKLTAVIAAGVVGTPAAGTASFSPGTAVTYSYSAGSGYDSVIVLLDHQPMPTSGTVLMDSNRVLTVAARQVIMALPGTEGLVNSAHGLLTAPDKVAAYQAFLTASMNYANSVDEATALDGLERVGALAFDEVADSAALEALDDALANNLFLVAGQNVPPPPDDKEHIAYVYVNGIKTTENKVAGRGGDLANLKKVIMSLPTYSSDGDLVTYFYNRTHRAQPGSSPDAVTRTLNCIDEASRRSVKQHEAWYNVLMDQCLLRVTVSSPDLLEAARQWLSLYSNSPTFETDADSLGQVIQTWRATGRHVMLIAHSQGNMMVQQAVIALQQSHQFDPTTDSIGIAALSLAAPSGFNWPLDAYHMAPINVSGDLVAQLGGFGSLATPLSGTATASIAAASAVNSLWGLVAQSYWGFSRLHSVSEAYLGQAVMRAAIRDSLSRLVREVTVGKVTASVSSAWLELEETLPLDATNVTIANGNGRKLAGRKAAITLGTPSVASVNSTGGVTGVSPGASDVYVASWAFADTVALTVSDRPADWGPPVTPFDSLSTGTWTGSWQGYAAWPGDVADQGSGSYTLVLEAHNEVIRGTATWTSPNGVFTKRINAGSNRVFVGWPPQPTSYVARVYFKSIDFPLDCVGLADHALDLVYDQVSLPSQLRTAYGYSYMSCFGLQNKPSDHSRRMTGMTKTSGPLSSLLAP